MMNQNASTKRRDLDFRSAAEVIEDIESLRTRRYRRVGNWNLTMVCQHLTATMNGGMDGFGFRIPWILRATIVKWAFQYSLNKRKLFAGAPTFKRLKPTHTPDSDDDAVIDECIQACRRANEFDGSLEEYALLDNLTPDKWRDFMWIHASHHLSFLVTED